MARKVRAVINREALSEIDLSVAKGLEWAALRILMKVEPPDAPPQDEGLVEGGFLISYVDGKRVGGDASKKPADMRVRGRGVAVGVGFGFPGRFQEFGTARQPPRPFLTPVVMEVAGDEALVADAVRRRWNEWANRQRARAHRSSLRG